MPGIEDVQPKQISTLGQPLVTDIQPVATQDAVQKLSEGFRSGYITAKDIMERNDVLTKTQQGAQLQLAREAVSPEAIEARKQAVQLATEKAAYERDTMFGKEAQEAYIRYNRVLYGPDGKPDSKGMQEVGQQYLDMERLLKYSQAGATPAGPPVTWIEGNKKHVAYYNIYGEDITQTPGKKNSILETHQKNIQKASSFLLHNKAEPSGEGESRLGGMVEPKAVPTAPPVIEMPPPSPMATGVAPFPMRGAPVVAPAPVSTPAPVVEPKAAPAVPVGKPMYEPGTGLEAGVDLDTLKEAQAIHKDALSSEFIKNWSEKSAIIGAFRETAAQYATNPKVTTLLDKDLATQAIFLSTPSAGGGMRGMQDLKAMNLAEAAPLIEKIYHIPAKLLGTETFSEETRNRLIQATERKAQALEGIARQTVKSAAEQIAGLGIDPSTVIYGPEKALFTGVPSASVSGAPSAGGSSSIPVTLSSGRRVTMTVRH